SIYYYIKLKKIERKKQLTDKTKKNILMIVTRSDEERWIFYYLSLNIYRSLTSQFNVDLIIREKFKPKLLEKIDLSKYDIIYTDQENGEIQKILELKKMPFFGSGSFGSDLAFNKIKAKKVADENSIKTPDWQMPGNNQTTAEINFPIISKQICGGSSIGIQIINNEKELKKYLKKQKNKRENFFEEFLNGDIYTIFLFENQDIKMPALKKYISQPSNYKKKYFNQKYKITYKNFLPAEKLIFTESEKLFKLFHLRDLARFDWVVYKNQPYFLEVNTMPGTWPGDFFEKSAQIIGLNYQTMIVSLFTKAIEKNNNK
ncbi:MAG: ATP-grasp domain-containing protein, partial [Candidatus Buchananbacteria bacterium]|nr:ATP-grasp domain-containing protein [Candidatus Buchananbacteria bacterium]